MALAAVGEARRATPRERLLALHAVAAAFAFPQAGTSAADHLANAHFVASPPRACNPPDAAGAISAPAAS